MEEMFGLGIGGQLVILIIWGVFWGFITRMINQSKGYDGGFWWGFFLGFLGLIIVACKGAIRGMIHHLHRIVTVAIRGILHHPHLRIVVAMLTLHYSLRRRR